MAMPKVLLAVVFLVTSVFTAASQDQGSEAAARDAAVVEAYRAGDYERALDLALDAFARAEEAFGPEHPQTLGSANNLAFLYESTGRYGEAEPLYRRALEVRERVLGPEHPQTLGSANNLAFLYESTGRYGEAEPLYRRALEARERVLGPEHPDTLVSVNNLAGLYEELWVNLVFGRFESWRCIWLV